MKKNIIIIVKDGMIEEIKIPKKSNIRIIVRDYDINDINENNIIKKDSDGNLFEETIWEQ